MSSPNANITNTLLQSEGKFMPTDSATKWWIRSGTTQFFGSGESATDAQARFYMPISYTEPFGGITQVTYYGSYYMMIETTQDALGNQSSVSIFNFRTLAAQRLEDINGNYSEAIADELGLVKALAVFGKGSEADDLTGLHEYTDTTESGNIYDFFNVAPILVPISTSPLINAKVTDYVTLTTKANTLLQHATTRFVYDFDRYKNTGKPVVVSSIVREQHYQLNNNSPLQISFEYSDGMGRVAMKKVQAEGGDAKYVALVSDTAIKVGTIDTSGLGTPQLRWIGNGKTIVNNKGNVVKQYEPYFSVTNGYEDFKELVESGVTPVLYYDAAGRLIRTDMPDGTYSRVEFDSWKQLVYDANDTVLDSEWYLKRTNGTITDLKEQAAAAKAAAHANTPNVLHFDTLGRPVLSLDYYDDITAHPTHCYATQIALDIESNMHTVTDARGNAVMTYKYDMLGHLVYQKSMDAGQRWLLTNVVSNPLRTWDERSHEFQYFYDVAHRPTASVVIGGDGATPLNNIFSKIVYGESLLTTGRTNESTLQVDNILGKPIETYDTGGGVTTPSYDFKGQPTAVNRQLFARYKEVADWTPTNIAADLETTVFTFSTQTDALGRITQQTAPDGSVITPSYNEAGLLNAESVLRTVSGTLTTSIYIKNIDYNEKGQRSRIIYGNDVSTNFYYDPLTFRLSNLISKRQNNDPLQDWFYTYDAVGNITHIEDDNIPTTFFNNTKTTGLSEYTYDALYRLIEATGRENDIALSFATENYDDSAFMGLFNSGDAMAIKSYTQQYEYDAVGNMLHMKHQATGNNWTRDYNYNTNNNRLTSTQVGSSTFSYNYHAQHGFIKSMSHLTVLDWNFKEEIAATSKQSVSSGTPETTYYQYDGSGQRIRKITENASTSGTPTLKNERIYIAGYERFENYLTTDVTETLSLLDEGHRFVMIEKSSVSGTLTRYQLHNHLGSSSLELDDSANIISYEEYHPFGTTSYQAKSATITATAKRYRYTGMERDEETGLNYHGARYYITWLGRWMNTDPIGIGDGVNVYRYCKNNPVMKHDPSGMAGEPPKEAEKRTIEHTTRMDGGDGKAIETKTAEVQFWHNEDANGKGGWYSGQEYGKMLEKVTLGMADNAHLLNELNGKTLAMGFSHRKDARTYLDEAKQAAQDFYAKNGNNLSEDNFLSITSNNIGAVAEDWNNHNTGSGKVESPAIDPIDFIGPGLIKVGAGILKTLAKTAVTVASKEAVKLLLVASLRSEIQGTVSSLTKVAQAEVRTLSSLPNAAKTSSNLWKVGAYNELQGVEAGLQAHHVGQKSLMGKLVPGYNPANAPSILVPEIGHVTNMPSIGRVAATRGLGGFTNARQVIVRDIFELRRVYGSQGIPNSSLQELIQMNKTMYPGAFIK